MGNLHTFNKTIYHDLLWVSDSMTGAHYMLRYRGNGRKKYTGKTIRPMDSRSVSLFIKYPSLTFWKKEPWFKISWVFFGSTRVCYWSRGLELSHYGRGESGDLQQAKAELCLVHWFWHVNMFEYTVLKSNALDWGLRLNNMIQDKKL